MALQILSTENGHASYLLALLMVQQGVASVTLTPEDQQALAQVVADDIVLVLGDTVDGCTEARFMLRADLPLDGQTHQ
jgi:hypothetical protein